MLLSRLVTFIDCKERVNERPTCGSSVLLVQESLKGKHKTHTLKKHSAPSLPACLPALFGVAVGDRHTGRSSGRQQTHWEIQWAADHCCHHTVVCVCAATKQQQQDKRELELSWSLNFKKAASASE